KPAPFGKPADEEFEYRFFIVAMVEVSLDHVELIEIGGERARRRRHAAGIPCIVYLDYSDYSAGTHALQPATGQLTPAARPPPGAADRLAGPQLRRNRGTNKQVHYFICEWKTAFRAAGSGYDWLMVRAPREADLVRLRQFLKRLEADAQGAFGNADVRHEIDSE